MPPCMIYLTKGRGVLGCLLVLAAGCSDVERQTVDRVEDHEPTVWTSPGDCEEKSAPMSSHAPRVGSWNIRYFPDSEEGTATDPEDMTDVNWLSCAIASLDVDVLAVQEFKVTKEARAKQADLIELLNQRTGGDWKLETSTCEPENVQHPGFLYDGARVTGSNFREIPALNPLEGCSNDASPGFAGYFKVEGGPDFHFVSVHFASGDAAGSMDARAESIEAMPATVSATQAVKPDTDVLFAGDFNTSGCSECDEPVESTDEIAGMAAQFDAAGNPLRLLPGSEDCSREDGDNSHLLDHFAVTDSMKETPAGAKAEVGGFCAEGACDRLRLWQEDARKRLSDHCPLILELAATDDD